MYKTHKARSAVNDFMCGLKLPTVTKNDRPERCRGYGMLHVTLERLAKIRCGHDFVKDVLFSCNHTHSVRLVK